MLTTLSILTLVLSQFTLAAEAPKFSEAQLVFAGVASIVLYAVFVFVQTVRHRDYFLLEGDDRKAAHVAPPRMRVTLLSLLLLLLSLVAVVGLAKVLSPAI